MKKNLLLGLVVAGVLGIGGASHTHAQSVYYAEPGDGVSHIAKRAGFSDWISEDRWNAIANLNNKNNYTEFNLQIGDAVIVAKETKPVQNPISANYSPKKNSYATGCDAYTDAINEASRKYSVRFLLLRAQLMAESGCNPNATSPGGDRGIAQIYPGNTSVTNAQAYNPYWAINWQGEKMGYLVRVYGERDALRAYNCGTEGMKYNNCGSGYANKILNMSK